MTDEVGADAVRDEVAEGEVETEVEAEQTETESESEADSPPADEENVEEKTDPFQERINKLTRNWRGTQRELAEARDTIRELQQKLTEPPEPRKTLEDFEFDQGKYIQYLFDESQKQEQSSVQDTYQKIRQQITAETLDKEFQSREAKFSRTVKDYHDTVYSDGLDISESMAEVAKAMPDGAEVLYYLGKNPDVATEISNLSPGLAGFRMREISDTLKAQKASASNSISKAPPPPSKKLGGGEQVEAIKTTDPKSDELSDEEWFKREEARLAKLRK